MSPSARERRLRDLAKEFLEVLRFVEPKSGDECFLCARQRYPLVNGIGYRMFDFGRKKRLICHLCGASLSKIVSREVGKFYIEHQKYPAWNNDRHPKFFQMIPKIFLAEWMAKAMERGAKRRAHLERLM